MCVTHATQLTKNLVLCKCMRDRERERLSECSCKGNIYVDLRASVCVCDKEKNRERLDTMMGAPLQDLCLWERAKKRERERKRCLKQQVIQHSLTHSLALSCIITWQNFQNCNNILLAIVA